MKSIGPDKAVSIAEILVPLAETVIATAPQQTRALRPTVIAEIAGHSNQGLPIRWPMPRSLPPVSVPGDRIRHRLCSFLVAEAMQALAGSRCQGNSPLT